MIEEQKNGENAGTEEQRLMNKLMRERSFAEYVHILVSLKDNLMILIAVKDTPGFCLRAEEKNFLNKLGLEQQFEGKHWHSYIAAINRGKVLVEKISANDEDTEDTFTVEKHGVRLFSSVYMRANAVEIVIDDINYAVDSRGFNIVIFDWNKEMVVDSVCFDKLVSHHHTVRKDELLTERIKELESEIRLMNSQLVSFNNFFVSQTEKLQMMLWQCFRMEGEDLTAAKQRFFLSLPKASGELRDLQIAGLILLVKFDHVCRKNKILYWLTFGGLLGAIRHHGCIPWDDDLDVAMMRDEFERVKAALSDDKDFYIKESVCVSIDNLNLCHQFAYRAYDVEVTMDIFIYDYSVETSESVIKKQIELNREIAEEGRSIANALGLDLSNGDILYEYTSAPSEFVQCIEKYNKKANESYGKNKSEAAGMIWSIENFRYIPAAKTNKNLLEVFPLCEAELEGHMFQVPSNALEYVNDMYGDAFSIPNDMNTHRHFSLNCAKKKILDEIIEKYEFILEEKADY